MNAASYPAHLNILLSPAGVPIEAGIHHTSGHKLGIVRYPSGVHRWACLLATGGAYPTREAGRKAILDLLERSPALEWVKPLLEAA